MNLPQYPVISSRDHHIYAFISEGPQGHIEKNVIYTHIGANVYNLGFGDWNEEKQTVDDFSRSNNGDRDKILATVAHTALEFTYHFPRAQLFVKGSSPARTRLYQMSMADNLPEITEKFEIKGVQNGQWEVFRKGVNYEGFLVKRK
jgi:hypothetical protein